MGAGPHTHRCGCLGAVAARKARRAAKGAK